MRVVVEAVIFRFQRVARRSCSLIQLDAAVEVARARSIVSGVTVDEDDIAHLLAYVASRERFYAEQTRLPPSIWADMEYFQLDHTTILDAYLCECAGALAQECDRSVLRTVVCALMHIATRTHSIRRFVQHDMYRFAPTDPHTVDVTRRLVAKLLDKIDTTPKCAECALVIAPPPEAV